MATMPASGGLSVHMQVAFYTVCDHRDRAPCGATASPRFFDRRHWRSPSAKGFLQHRLCCRKFLQHMSCCEKICNIGQGAYLFCNKGLFTAFFLQQMSCCNFFTAKISLHFFFCSRGLVTILYATETLLQKSEVRSGHIISSD